MKTYKELNICYILFQIWYASIAKDWGIKNGHAHYERTLVEEEGGKGVEIRGGESS